MRNPLVIDCKGSIYSNIKYNNTAKDTYDWCEYAEKNGYDGVIFKDVRDGAEYGDLQIPTTDYVAFSPNQIKSATDNNGEFSKTNDDILHLDTFEQGEEQTPTSEVPDLQQVVDKVNEVIKLLNLKNVEIITDDSQLEKDEVVPFSTKGGYRRSEGRIRIYAHHIESLAQAEQAVLHEAVGHYGLRVLLGKHFNEFITKVYDNADAKARRGIAELAAKNKWDIYKATEEYLSELAQKTDFEKINPTFWEKVKMWFKDMLRKVGFKNIEMSENEMRYELWRSYQNLKGNKYSNVFSVAEDIAMQNELKVGKFEDDWLYMRGYHGSGSKFDKFDHAHMGEGEGAQAYGWGTYVTEVNGIARGYAKASAGQVAGYNARLVKKQMFLESCKQELEFVKKDEYRELCAKEAERCRKRLSEHPEMSEEEREEMNDHLEDMLSGMTVEGQREYIELLEDNIRDYEQDIKDILRGKDGKRHLYTVEIPDDTGSNYLRWDKKVPKSTLNTIIQGLRDNGHKVEIDSEGLFVDSKFIINSQADGEGLYNSLSRILGNGRSFRESSVSGIAASEFLSSCGFTGIKYPAQYRSGGRRDGAMNYVIFKESDAQILEDEMFMDTKEQGGGNELKRLNDNFNKGLQLQIDGKLPDGYTYELGIPSKYLRSTGIPKLPIRLQPKTLNIKSNDPEHPYSLEEIRDLVKMIQKPIAIFVYGDKTKAQNLMIGLKQEGKEGKQFLVGISINPTVNGAELLINSVRNVFPKSYHDWIHWINQNKLLRVDNKAEIQAIIDALRTNPVDYINDDDLNSATNVVENFENPTLPEENSNASDDWLNMDTSEQDTNTPEGYSKALARDTYERRVKTGMYQSLEALQDSMLGLKELMLAVMKASGDKRYIEEMEGYMNPYTSENALSSINNAEKNAMEMMLFKPLVKEIALLAKNDDERGELYDYMMAKHGLERNRVMAERDAKVAAVKDTSKSYDEIRDMLFCGLHHKKTASDLVLKRF